MNDEELSPPFAAADTLGALTDRLGGVSASGDANILPGWDWAVIMSGLEGAVSRYKTGLGTSTGVAARAAVGEALWWIASADEFIRKRVSNGMSLSAYSKEVQKRKAGRRLAGLVYLRNRAGHQMAALLVQAVASKSADFKVIQDDDTVTTETLTARLNAHMKAFDISPPEGYFFALSRSLPSSDAGFAEHCQRDICYYELVANRPVTDVLEAVARSLNRVITFERGSEGVMIRVNGSGKLPA